MAKVDRKFLPGSFWASSRLKRTFAPDFCPSIPLKRFSLPCREGCLGHERRALPTKPTALPLRLHPTRMIR